MKELLKLLSTSEIVAQIVNFLLLLFLLRVFFWKKILKLLDERKESIAGEFKNIEDTKVEVEKLKSGYEEKFKTIEETSRMKIKEAVEEGKKIAQSIKDDALSQSQKIIDSAKADIKQEIAKARESLKEEIVNVSMRAVENIIEEKLTPDKDKKLVEKFLEDIDKIK